MGAPADGSVMASPSRVVIHARGVGATALTATPVAMPLRMSVPFMMRRLARLLRCDLRGQVPRQVALERTPRIRFIGHASLDAAFCQLDAQSIAHAGTDQHVHGVQRVRLAGRRLVQAAARWQLDQLGLANAGALNFVDEEVAAPSGVFGDLTAILAGQGNEGHVGPLIGVVCCRPEARHSAGSSVQSNATAVPPVGPMPWGCCDRHLRPIRHAARRTEVFENCRFGSSDGMDCHS